MYRLAIVALACAACDASFEKTSIVLDLRVLALRNDPAEVVVDIDPANPTSLDPSSVPAVTITALLGDPMGPRPLAYTFTACPVTDSLRCDDAGAPRRTFATATTGDVDAAPPTGTLRVDLELLQAALAADKFHGLGGVPVQLELAIRPDGAPTEATIFASKLITYSPRIPAGRVANRNPFIASLVVDGTPSDPNAPLTVTTHREVVFEPVELDAVRETYIVPTLDGGQREFTENLRYSWYAEAGDFSDEKTGGPVDVFGNHPLLRTRWTAPGTPGTFHFWVVQRDERGGTYWTKRSIIVQN